MFLRGFIIAAISCNFKVRSISMTLVIIGQSGDQHDKIDVKGEKLWCLWDQWIYPKVSSVFYLTCPFQYWTGTYPSHILIGHLTNLCHSEASSKIKIWRLIWFLCTKFWFNLKILESINNTYSSMKKFCGVMEGLLCERKKSLYS